MEPIKQTNKLLSIVAGVLVVSAVGGITYYSEKGSANSNQTSADTANISIASRVTPNVSTVGTTHIPLSDATVAAIPPATVPKSASSYIYKDGTYTATGSYMSPGGEEQITVTITLANDVITTVSVTPGAGDRTSQRYQNYFISGYKSYVIGKNMADVNLTVVSGSSLTPIGFNNALSQIKAQAKA